jgi:hypothetical protein
MRRPLIVVLLAMLVCLIFLLGTSSTAMAAPKKPGSGSASYAKRFHVAKTGKPKAPKYVPKQKKAHKSAAKAKKH